MVQIVLFAVLGLVAAALCPLAYRYLPTSWYPAVFFALKCFGSRVLDFERVRYAMAFQICVIALLALLACSKRGLPKPCRAPYGASAWVLWLSFFAAVALSVIWGIAQGNALSQVVIDSYKFLEIPVLYVLFRMAWRDGRDVDTGLAALAVVMLACGVIEMFVTERGGVGLSLAMSLVPIVVCRLAQDRSHAPALLGFIALSLLIVVTCQTRTYIAGFAVGLALSAVLLGSRVRFKLVFGLMAIICSLLIVDAALGGAILGDTLSRFSELSAGFEEAGGYRADELAVACSLIAGAPVLGVGLGYLHVFMVGDMGYIEWGSFLHNAYVEVLLKCGVVGLSAFCLLAIAALALVWRGAGRARGDARLASACKGGVVSALSWLAIFLAAPTTTFGCIFIGPIIGAVAIRTYESEREDAEDAEDGPLRPCGRHFRAPGLEGEAL